MISIIFLTGFVDSLRIESKSLRVEKRRSEVVPNDHLVTSLPNLPPNLYSGKHYAGRIPVNGGKLFYWLFESRNDPSKDPLVIWLNGGPGCSSMDGLFLENGPLRLPGSKSKEIKINPDSWNNISNMVYLDQPVGTGLSITKHDKYADNEDQVDENVHMFLQSFMEIHTSYKGRDIYFTGESHAGHYIPSMMSYILKKNKLIRAGKEVGIILDVKGAAIGNGWTAPIYQYDVSDFAFGSGLISEGQMRTLKERNKACVSRIQNRVYNSVDCYSLLDNVIDGSGSNGNRVCMYDVRLYGVDFPIGKTSIMDYLNRSDVRKAIHVDDDPDKYVECANPPFYHLEKWDGLGVMPQVAELLESGQRLLFFNGQYDLICNHIGNERWLFELDWSGAELYRKAGRATWQPIHNEEPAGYYKSAENGLGFLVVRNAGHMVPMDVPKQAVDMINRFLSNKTFADYSQNLTSKDGEWGGFLENCSVSEVRTIPSPSILYPILSNLDSVQVAFSPSTGNNSEYVSKYIVTSSPEGKMAEGSESPMIVENLSPGVAYTFSVTAVTEDGQTSLPSEGSSVVIPGCSTTFEELPCGKNGSCTRDGSNARCSCIEGWFGDTCDKELPQNIPLFQNCLDPVLSEKIDLFTIPSHQCPELHVCTFDWLVRMSSKAFPPGRISLDRDAENLEEKDAFEILLKGDFARALGLPLWVLSVSNMNSTKVGNLDITLRLSSVAQITVNSIPAQWNFPDSALHTGIFTRFIDYSVPTSFSLVSDLGPGNFNVEDLHVEGKSENQGYSLKNTVLFVILSFAIMCFGLGIGWLFWGRKKRRSNVLYELANTSYKNDNEL